MRVPTPATSTHTSPPAIVVYRQFCLYKWAACEAFLALVLPSAALASINDSATRRSIFLLTRARCGASTAICGMAEQDLDRAAPPLRQRLGGSGDTPGTAYNRILIDFVDITLRMQQFGRDSIGPNHEMYEYSKGILERSTGRLVDIAFSSTQAFGFSVDGVVPPDDVAGFHAMDVLRKTYEI